MAQPRLLSFISPTATPRTALLKCSAEVLDLRVQFHGPFDVAEPST